MGQQVKTKVEELRQITSFGYANYQRESEEKIRELIEAAFAEIEQTNHGRMDKETTIYMFRLHRSAFYNYIEMPEEDYKEILLAALDVLEQEIKYGLKLSLTTEEVSFLLTKLS